MRTLIIVLVFATAGAAFGGVSAWNEFSNVKERFDPNNGDTLQEAHLANAAEREGKSLDATAGARVAVVNGELHDFGSVDRGTKGSHDFLFKNEGTVPLKIQTGGTSCPVCTVSTLPKSTIEPGETIPVSVSWNPMTPDSDFRKEAYIQTSDPDRPLVILVVQGRVEESVRILPSELTLNNVTSSSSVIVEARVLCHREGEFLVEGHEFTNPDLAEYFEATLTRLDDATNERMRSKSGYGIQITVKEGLPLGAIVQSLKLKTNWPGSETIELPIRGNTVSDISILASKNFDARKNVLTLGIVKSETGTKVTLPVLVKGPHRESVELSVASIDPAASLQVTLGEPKSLNGGVVRMIPLHVEVPVGSPPVSLMGGIDRKDYGKILINTTHPDAPQLQLWVRFAVE